MFGKKQKTIFDYVDADAHNPFYGIADMKKPSYLEGTASVDHKELESIVEEYWDIIHPLILDFINSYANTVENMNVEMSASREHLENARRQLTFEQQNVQDITDQYRELKGEMQNLLVVKRDLEGRLNDEREYLENQFNEEKRALELIASSKVSSDDITKIISEVSKGMGESEKYKALEKKVHDLEAQIEKEREENESIQGELSMSFMEKITKMDEMINNLKSRLNE